MIAADELARTLSVGVDDLVDVGPVGFATGARRAGRRAARARGSARGVPGARRARRRARRVAARGGAPLRRLDGAGQRACGRRARGRERGARSRCCAPIPDDDPEHGAARALERAGFAALLLELRGEPVARAAVVTLAAGVEPTRSAVAFGREAWGRLLAERVEELARRTEVELGRVRARRALEPRFPFPEPRPVQQAMLREVAGAAASGLVLLCSAPTGVGKTAAALFPFLSAALREDRRVFFVTSRTSQQELALETLRRNAAGRRRRARAADLGQGARLPAAAARLRRAPLPVGPPLRGAARAHGPPRRARRRRRGHVGRGRGRRARARAVPVRGRPAPGAALERRSCAT